MCTFFCVSGSGSLAAMATFEDRFKPDMSVSTSVSVVCCCSHFFPQFKLCLPDTVGLKLELAPGGTDAPSRLFTKGVQLSVSSFFSLSD